MIKPLLLAAALVATQAQAGNEISRNVKLGTTCIGGYLHSYAFYDGHKKGGISIQQLFESGELKYDPVKPIKCKEKDNE